MKNTKVSPKPKNVNVKPYDTGRSSVEEIELTPSRLVKKKGMGKLVDFSIS
jgi:hypothetical protein